MDFPAGVHLMPVNVPERTCQGCRRPSPKADLVRLAWDPAMAGVVVDPRQRLSGRGCYVHRGCAAALLRRRVVGRVLRRSVVEAQLGGVLAAAGLIQLDSLADG